MGIVTDVPLSGLPPDEKAERASSFGEVAETYEAFRPGPADSAIDWILEGRHVDVALDLGAGTGACSRLLLAHADHVNAVEPDERMREILKAEVPTATVLAGQGESIPLPDSSADAIFASSSWHWMEPEADAARSGKSAAAWRRRRRPVVGARSRGSLHGPSQSLT
jgi:ubiquinone/menaquinone biosynthesis C-methylase UbiE